MCHRSKIPRPGIHLRKPFTLFVNDELKPSILLITCGLPGTWKTETSQEISRIKGYPILRTDLIRLEVLRNDDVFSEDVASDMRKRELVYIEMFRRAEDLLVQKKGVILDATFITQKLRRRAAAIAAKTNISFVILQTRCTEEASIKRILRRTRDKYESNALTKQAYLNNKKRFEPVDLEELKRIHPQLEILYFTINTEQDTPSDWYITGMKKL